MVLDKNGSFILAGLVSRISKNLRSRELRGFRVFLKNTQKKFYVRSKEGAALLQHIRVMVYSKLL